MSIENLLERIARAAENCAELLAAGVKIDGAEPPNPPEAVPSPQPAPPAPVTPPPAPNPPEAVPSEPLPFANLNEVQAWMMTQYNRLRAVSLEKAQEINTVMNEMGVGHISNLKPEQYVELKRRVEAL